MSNRSLKSELNKIISDLIKLSELKWEYFKLDIIESLVVIYTKVFSMLLVWIIVPMVLLFGFTALGLYLGHLWGKMYLGFLAVSGIVLVLGLIVLMFKPAITNTMVRIFVSAMVNQKRITPIKSKSHVHTTAENKDFKRSAVSEEAARKAHND